MENRSASFQESDGTGPLDSWEAAPASAEWRGVEKRFLAAVSPAQRDAVRALLARLPDGSYGLHAWLCALTWGGAFLPALLPVELVAVYLWDAEAAPLAECVDCGLALPIRAGRRRDAAGWGDCSFTACPACGGQPGWCRPA